MKRILIYVLLVIATGLGIAAYLEIQSGKAVERRMTNPEGADSGTDRLLDPSDGAVANPADNNEVD